MNTKAKLVKKKYLVPFILITSLVALWGFANDITNPMVAAFLFIPAAAYQQFSFFCISLYILTFGLAFLETTANPYILSLGSKETSTRRLNLAQTFNPMGSLCGMAVASFVVLPELCFCS